MRTIPLLVVLLAQGLFGSAYVVLEEEDGYYRAWRSNPFEQKQNQWSSLMNPQNYLSFFQNMNPFSWMWQAQQQSLMQENSMLNALYDRQKALFNIMRCLVEGESKMMCRHLLGNAMPLFPGSVHVNEIWITNSGAPKPMQEKPMDIETMIMIAKPIEVEVQTVQIKPIENEKPMMKMKPSIVQPELPDRLKSEAEVKLSEDMKAMEGKPLLEESVTEMKLIDMEATTMEVKPMEKEPPMEASKPMNTDPAMEAVKPMEAEPTAKPMEEPEMKPTETAAAEMEMKKPMEDKLKSTEAEPGVV